MPNKYSKWIVLLVIILNIGFLVYIRNVMFTLGFEPTATIVGWYQFTGIELLALATITVVKTVKGKERNEE